MSSIFSLDEIKEYWTKKAMDNKLNHAASWSDIYMMQLEIKSILKFVDHFDKVLDVGCANGYKTIELANRKSININGVDYIPEMVEQAKLQKCKNPDSNVSFSVGNILNIGDMNVEYNKVIVSRVLINLHDSYQQMHGIQECSEVLTSGGLLLISEATIQGFNKLNRLRSMCGLKPLVIPKFNAYIDEAELTKHQSTGLKFEKLIDFSSTYYIGTRIIKPLLYRIIKSKKDVGNVNSIYNKIFKNFPSVGGFGIQKLFVFRKI
jgi:SAM-dependent methyltransferase